MLLAVATINQDVVDVIDGKAGAIIKGKRYSTLKGRGGVNKTKRHDFLFL